MKKIVAVVLIAVAILMSGMFVWGFFDKQNKENIPESTTDTVPKSPEVPSSTQSDSSSIDNKSINASELSRHNKSEDCWVAIRGNVYNVTSYLNQHPGGADLILNYCGKDATAAFNNKGGEGKHSTRAEALLNNYLIGSFN